MLETKSSFTCGESNMANKMLHYFIILLPRLHVKLDIFSCCVLGMLNCDIKTTEHFFSALP